MSGAQARRTVDLPPVNVVFDQSGHFLIYPTMLGIKGANIVCCLERTLDTRTARGSAT